MVMVKLRKLQMVLTLLKAVVRFRICLILNCKVLNYEITLSIGTPEVNERTQNDADAAENNGTHKRGSLLFIFESEQF